MDDIHPHPRSNTKYRLMDDSPTNAVTKERHVSFKIASAKKAAQKEEDDYSASNEESSVDFAEDDSPLHSPSRKKFGVSNKPLSLDKTWKNEVVSITDDKFDEEACTSSSLKNSVKFVNGLPTVVKKNTSHKFHCIKCHFEGFTKVEYHIGQPLKIVMLVFLFILFWPCLAYLAWSNDWKDIIHTCPKCGHVVGKRRLTHEKFKT